LVDRAPGARRFVRQAILGVTIVVVVALIGIGIEQLHRSRLRGAAESLERSIAMHASERAESKSLALEVARYQEFARQAHASRRSGPEAAIAIARIGNDVPGHAWLDSLARSGAGYDLGGEAATVEEISRTILRLGHALPNGATLVSIDNRQHEGVRFSAHVGAAEIPDSLRARSAAR
jgi:hypothetical protein